MRSQFRLRRVQMTVRVLKYLSLAMLLRWLVSTREDALYFIGVWGLVSVVLWMAAWRIDRTLRD